MNNYQEDAARTIDPTQSAKDQLTNWCFGLAGETGEVIDHIKKHLFHGHPVDKNYITKEVGDVLWYLAALCTTLDLELPQVAAQNIAKLKDRYPEGFSEERSRTRSAEPTLPAC